MAAMQGKSMRPVIMAGHFCLGVFLMESRIFDKKNIIVSKVNEDDLNSFLVDMDIGDDGQPYYPINELASCIINTIPEYVFAQYENPEIPQSDAVEKLREAARSIYKIKNFDIMRRWYLEHDEAARAEIEKLPENQRGEFGELLLHLILRDFKGTVPLISKVYFKDSASVPAHGFDAVHISPDEKILWLGESKFYNDGKIGVRKLLEDLAEHFTRDFLNDQFAIIKKNLENNSIPQRDEWIKTLSNCSKLQEKISMINIPMLCTYTHDIYQRFSDFTKDDAITYHETNIRELKQYFDEKNEHPLKAQLNVILLLFPVRNKKELVIKLHEKLWHMQSM